MNVQNTLSHSLLEDGVSFSMVLADQIIEKGHIAAYKIDWSGGEWTGWYISGVNDLDDYYSPEPKECLLSYRANTIRRKWAFIY
jgi:hypothetical protein